MIRVLERRWDDLTKYSQKKLVTSLELLVVACLNATAELNPRLGLIVRSERFIHK